ncbi:actin-regulating kinase prk1 [Stylosanthes scabra]|uniref:Actin-regulating kinase prk1 n=1 Tax=Stylosanthes scabra TaxID=79078 RepID=A0ABU6T9G3_9FABA|nr:actin-regulating kinase prk1 [Stylosanthes scabra]
MALIIAGRGRGRGWPCTIILMIHLVVTIFGASDTDLLLKFKESLQFNGDPLSSWNATMPPCNGGKPNWPHIFCYNGNTWGIKLERMGIKGSIDVDSLKGLPYLRTISLMHNNLQGSWPELNKLPGLKAVYLSDNQFSGEIPGDAFAGMQWLKKIYLSNNKFSGPLPSSLTTMPRLRELRLEGNQFKGTIPELPPTLRSLCVANNELEGQIPRNLTKFPRASFAPGNKKLCGFPLKNRCASNKTSLASVLVLAILALLALLVIAFILLLFLHKKKKQRKEERTHHHHQPPIITTHHHQPPITTTTASTREPAETSLPLETPPSIPSTLHKKVGDLSDDIDGGGSVRSLKSSNIGSSRGSKKSESLRLSFVKLEEGSEEFDMQDLLKASAEILGSGPYSSSYKASLLSGTKMVVVKRYKQMNNCNKDEFQEHMRRIGMLNHPNLLPLVAYYFRKEEKLLVTDFVANGSLCVRLHGHQALGLPSLKWPTRLKIVKGISIGLEFLYKEMPSLIAPHGHLKSSNVLLNESYEPILADYALVPLINQELAPDIMVIYKSPEYLQQGRVTKKSDVWSLGILILEILTGKIPSNFLQQGKGSELSLANWVDSIVPEQWSGEVFDKQMGASKENEVEISKLLRIALACCEADVNKRLDIKEAVERIQEVKESGGN